MMGHTRQSSMINANSAAYDEAKFGYECCPTWVGLVCTSVRSWTLEILAYLSKAIKIGIEIQQTDDLLMSKLFDTSKPPNLRTINATILERNIHKRIGQRIKQCYAILCHCFPASWRHHTFLGQIPKISASNNPGFQVCAAMLIFAKAKSVWKSRMAMWRKERDASDYEANDPIKKSMISHWITSTRRRKRRRKGPPS